MNIATVVINAGLGDLTLGLQKAGFDVIADYETDQKAGAIHSQNFDIPVYPLLSEETDDFLLRAEISFLAARLCLQSAWNRSALERENDLAVWKFQTMLHQCRPKGFLLLISCGSKKNEGVFAFLQKLVGEDYRFACQRIDVGALTGFPVVEHKLFVVGYLPGAEPFQFSTLKSEKALPLDKFVSFQYNIDFERFQIQTEQMPIEDDGGEPGLFCWGKQGYHRSDRVRWNYINPPFVRVERDARRLTCVEIARLKAFPDNYVQLAFRDTQWMAKKLSLSCNILAIQKIAEALRYYVMDSPWQSRRISAAAQFAELFYRYLVSWAGQDAVQPARDIWADFSVSFKQQNLYFDLKMYRNDTALWASLEKICRRFSARNVDGQCILVVANEVPMSQKQQLLKKFQVFIWDVSNLLWVFDPYPEIKRDFIALLDYSVCEIAAEPPFQNLTQKHAQHQEEPLSWEKRLKQIEAGQEQFAEYESLCTELLKYLLNDYLTLWSTQEKSNGGLYRFDLCCKIKIGVNHEFFDTIRQYFNTKYIVFEFKNYSGGISQKEIYTTEKYLYEKALRKVAIVISRQGADENALQAAKGCLRENGKLILCLSDADMLQMIAIREKGENAADYLSDMLDDILLHLEK